MNSEQLNANAISGVADAEKLSSDKILIIFLSVLLLDIYSQFIFKVSIAHSARNVKQEEK